MQTRIVARFPIFVLAALAALTFWLDQHLQPVAERDDGSQRHDPDYIVENFSATRMNDAGQPDNALAGVRMVHYPDDDSTEISEPRYAHFKAGEPPVTITSDRATVSSDGVDVYFHDNVVVTSPAQGKRAKRVLTTDFLHVIPDQRLARTDRPVILREADSTVHALGLQLDAESRVLRLSGVRATYFVRR